DLDLHTGVDQPEFGEDRTQRPDLGGVAAVERREGEQGGFLRSGGGHSGRSGAWRGAYSSLRVAPPPSAGGHGTARTAHHGSRILPAAPAMLPSAASGRCHDGQIE